MRLSIKLPEGLSNRRCKQFNPTKMDRLPPMHFVTKSNLNNADKDGKHRVKITITEHVTKSFKLFSEGEPEAVILLI